MLLRIRKILRRIKEGYEDSCITYTYFKNGVKFRKPTEEEKQLAISVRDFVEAGCSVSFDERQEVWSVRSFPDGVFELKYSYVHEDAQSLRRFLMTTRIEIANTPSLALELFQEGVAARKTGAANVGGRFVFKGNLLKWSDTAYGALTLAEPNETIVGCVLSFQKERMVYSITLRGLFFESSDDVEEFIYPYLERALAWSRRDV